MKFWPLETIKHALGVLMGLDIFHSAVFFYFLPKDMFFHSAIIFLGPLHMDIKIIRKHFLNRTQSIL